MRPGFFKTLIAAAAAGGGVALAQRSASTLNVIKPQLFRSGNVRTDHIVRTPFILGSCDWDDLQVSVYNWIFKTYGVNFSEGTDFEIVECAIDIGANWKKVTWGGADSITVTPGQTDIKSDKIFATDFPALGSAFFPKGTTGGIRYKIRADATKKFPDSHAYMFGTNRYRFTPGLATVTNGVYGTGNFSIGGAYDGTFEPFTPVLVGTPRSAGKFLAGLGDSITAIVGDSGYQTFGPAFHRAAYTNYSTGANPLGCINFGCPGGTIMNWIGDGTNTPANASATVPNIGLPEAYLKYANIVFEQYGTNGTYSTGGGTYTHTDKLWTVIKRGAADCKLVRSSLFPRTADNPAGSADEWATIASQVPTQIPGGDTDLFEQYCAGKVGAGLVDYYINYNSPRANTNRANVDYYKWAVNGTANWATKDGLHPEAVMHDLIYGTEARALIDTITP